MNKVTKEQLAYIAGIIDGEGTLSLVGGQAISVDSYGRSYRSFQLTVRVGNTNKILIDWLQSKSGIGITRMISDRSYNQPKLKNSKRAHYWQLSANEVRELLPKIVPFLVIKKRQAEIMIHWLSHLTGVRGRAMTDKIFNEKIEIVKEMKRLNKRGLK